MAIREIRVTASLDGFGQPQAISGVLFGGETLAHKFIVSDAGGASLSGSVSAKFLRYADNVTVPLTGSIESGKAAVTLSANCYYKPGRFKLTIYITASGSMTAIYSCTGSVDRTDSDRTIDPGGEITIDVAQLIADVDDARASIQTERAAAQQAASDAAASKTAAQSAQTSAAGSASSASASAAAAQDIAESMSYPVSIARGGTGATTLAAAQTALGIKNGVTLYNLAQIEALSSSTQTVNLTSGRRLSSYPLLLLQWGQGGYIRESMMVYNALFEGNPAVLSYVDSSNVQRWAQVTYVSDTSVSFVGSSNAAGFVVVYGIGLA